MSVGNSAEFLHEVVPQAEQVEPVKAVESKRTPEEQTLVEFGKRNINTAAEKIHQLIKEGRLKTSDFYMQSLSDPLDQQVIDEVHEMFDYDRPMLALVSQQVDTLIYREKVTKNIEMFVQKVLRAPQPRLSEGSEFPERRLSNALDSKNIRELYSALVDLGQLSESERSDMETIVKNPEYAQMLFDKYESEHDRLANAD